MSPRARRASTAQHHVEWLQLVDVSGPFLSLGVLAEVFPLGLDAVEPELAERLKQAYAEWQANKHSLPVSQQAITVLELTARFWEHSKT